MKTWEIVEFFWVDSDRYEGWQDISKDEGAPAELKSDLCFSSGILLSENQRYIKITSSIAPGQRLSPLTVPKVAIVGKILRRKRKFSLRV